MQLRKTVSYLEKAAIHKLIYGNIANLLAAYHNQAEQPYRLHAITLDGHPSAGGPAYP